MNQVTYDHENDVLYVQLRDGNSVRQSLIGDLCVVDYGADDAVLGIEFLGASEGVDLSNVPAADAIQRLIDETDLSIPALT